MKLRAYVVAASLSVAILAQADTLTIHAVDNIFGAGHTTAPAPSGSGGGTLPPSFSFAPGVGQTITVTNVAGSVVYFTGVGSKPCDPDGNPFVEARDVSSFGGISGIVTPTRFPLLGVFLSDAEPLDRAPSRLDFTAGSGISFTTLSPVIGQTFFIGDGLTGTGTGTIQQFQVPATATRLFLGFGDTRGDPGDGPGSFFNNSGSFTANVSMIPAPTTAPTTAPAVQYPSLLLRPGGPPWELRDVEASLPDGTLSLEMDNNAGNIEVTNAAGAIKKCLQLLASGEKRDQEIAYRIAGATAKATDDVIAHKLLAFLKFHGIGIKADERSAYWSAAAAALQGDRDAFIYLAEKSPGSLRTKVPFVRKLDGATQDMESRGVAVSGFIIGMENGLFVLRTNDEEDVVVKVGRPLPDARLGRYAKVFGVLADSEFTGYICDTPPPQGALRWKILQKPVVGGEWQLHGVEVKVKNVGKQHIRNAKVHVRCWLNKGKLNDHSTDVWTGEIKPGETKTVIANFEMFNFQYLDDLTAPKAQVTLQQVDW